MDRIIILIIVYLIACYIWKKIDCSRHRKIHNAVYIKYNGNHRLYNTIKFHIYNFVRNHIDIIRLSGKKSMDCIR